MSFAFEWGWCEEPTVEEWDVTEGASGRSALVPWCVQRAEEEWAEEAMVERTAEFEGSCGMLKEEIAIAIEPTFRFEEGEEEAA